ncbi:hypothetical protein FNV43_RR21370 [Rhamnella rubrinervis]|uniref:RNase H type-1 domain-containing protein n=1 Tax=Rhamnella rubrinervis TaxID=2594499 RepID=A0A8K0E8A8_9ROSA|nr:hypothetical protein FNV43_RR21370 [Rhamnella rubrinervis]
MGVHVSSIYSWYISNVEQLMDLCMSGEARIGEMSKESSSIFFACLFYTTWKLRNEVLFEGKRGFALCFAISKNGGGVHFSLEFRHHSLWKQFVFQANAAGVIVIRTAQGETLFVASPVLECSSPHAAEVLALNWASKIAEENDQTKIIWACDDKEVIQEVLCEL